MALNKLKKWIGTQAMTAFFDQLNDNVDATNAAIDLAEQNLANINLLDGVQVAASAGLGAGVVFNSNLEDESIYLLVIGRTHGLYVISSQWGAVDISAILATPGTGTVTTSGGLNLTIDFSTTTRHFILLRLK